MCHDTYIERKKIMNTHKKIYTMMLSALLVAVGTVIPMFMPKVVIPPMSFTIASHVAVMLGIFISPTVATFVALGTTLGFFVSGTPFIVVLRALSHVIWAFGGGLYIQKHPETFTSPLKSLSFNFVMSLIHALAEVIVVTPFYIGTMSVETFIMTVFVLVGVGSLIHSMVDFTISLMVWKVLSKNASIADISNVKKVYFVKNA